MKNLFQRKNAFLALGLVFAFALGTVFSGSSDEGLQGKFQMIEPVKLGEGSVVDKKVVDKDANRLVPSDEALQRVKDREGYDDNVPMQPYEAMSDDGVVYFDGRCTPGAADGLGVVLEKGASAGVYNDWVRSMMAELDSNERVRDGETQVKFNCPYLVEIFYSVDIDRPMLSLVCNDNYYNSAKLDGDSAFSCMSDGFVHKFALSDGNWSRVSQLLEGMSLEFIDIWFWNSSGGPGGARSYDLPIRVTRMPYNYTLN